MLGIKLGNGKLAYGSDNPIAQLNAYSRISIFLNSIPKSSQPATPPR